MNCPKCSRPMAEVFTAVGGSVGDLKEPEFPMIAAPCPLKTQEVMEAVAQAAAGGTASVIVAIRMERSPEGRDTFRDVPVAVILGADDFRNLTIKTKDDPHRPTRSWPLGINPFWDKAASDQGMGHWSCLSHGSNIRWMRRDGIDCHLHDREKLDREFPIGAPVFQNVEVCPVDRGPDIPPGWIKDPAPGLDPGPFGMPVDSEHLLTCSESLGFYLKGDWESRKMAAVRQLIGRCLEWFQSREVPDAEGK